MSVNILSGNELIIQGALEAGFSLYTGYPGSPLADYFNILYNRKDEFSEKGIKVVIGNSEANAAAMASGAKQAGRDTIVAMKSMGLHVASDALSVGNFSNPGPREIDPVTKKEIAPGVVIVVGDDPWSTSTSTPADSRYLFKHLHMPFLEPSTPQELKDWIGKALKVSKDSSVYCGVLLTTFMAEGGGRVKLEREKEVSKELPHFDPKSFDLQKNVMVPPNSLIADKIMIHERFPKVIESLKSLKLEKQFGSNSSRIGIISTGVIFQTLMQVIQDKNLLSHVSVLKLAGSYPLVKENIEDWARSKEKIIIVEEKRGFLESEFSQFVLEIGHKCEIFGKKFKESNGFPSHGGLSYEIISSKLDEMFKELDLGLNSNQSVVEVADWEFPLPARLPTFCPGCPHRETLSLLKELRKDLKKKGVNLISHGDVGCYSLSFLEPFKEMHNLSAMGQGGALGAGFDFFSDNPSVVLMGDSTFFHSGLTDISNSVQSNHNITYILLDNDNTAMTGHQVTPVSGISVEGSSRPRQDISKVVQGLGVVDTIEVNPSDRYFYKNLLADYINKKGVKVIISTKECGLTFQSKKKKLEKNALIENGALDKKVFYQINTDSCENCLECVSMTGCPGLGLTQDAYGDKIYIDPQICVSDSYCTKLKVCPSFEKVEVNNYHPTKYKISNNENKNIFDRKLPQPNVLVSYEDISQSKDWRTVVTGVGGSGVTTISKVLAQASVEMGGRKDLDFKFMDQKGLAQRNGRVTGHLAIHNKEKFSGTVTPLRQANLILSPDLLDGASAINFLSNGGVLIIDESYQVPLTLVLDKAEDTQKINEEKLRKKLIDKLGDKVILLPFKKTAEKFLGKAVYTSTMILGTAFQKGLLPFSFEDMEKALKKSVNKSEVDNNLKAFHLGRILAIEELDLNKQDVLSFSDFKASLRESFLPWHSSRILLNMFERDVDRLRGIFPTLSLLDAAQFMHDIYLYDRGGKREQFFSLVADIKLHYDRDDLWIIALRVLVKTFFIKDEVFISHQMISSIKKKRDHNSWSKFGESFKIIRINRPHFDIFGFNVEFDINPKMWMLKLMRHLRFLRVLLPSWHRKEKEIAFRIRKELFEKIPKLSPEHQRKSLCKLDGVKGYRQVRYENAKNAFFDLDVIESRLADDGTSQL